MATRNPEARRRRQGWSVYILLCRDKTYYTGATNNVPARVEKHNKGNGAKYTRGRRPVKLVYSENLKTKRQALRREAEIKKWSRQRKAALVKRTTTGD